MMAPGMFRPRRSFAGVIFTTLATTIFGLSLTLNLYLLFASGIGGSSERINQKVYIEGDPRQKIAVIPITGTIMRPTAEHFDLMLNAAEKDADVKAIVLDVDTPGGAVTASDEIRARIERFRKNNPKRPVVVTMGGLATSGGYYVSCAADYIYAQPNTWTGNIGVIMPRLNYSKLVKSYGVEEVTVTAPAKGFKNAFSPYSPVDEKDNQYLQGLAQDAFDKFKAVVVAGRQGKLSDTIDHIADGKVYAGDDAKKAGLVDQIGYANDAYDKAASMAQLTNKHVVKYSRPSTLFDLLGGVEGKSNVKAGIDGGVGGNVTINGVNVNVDANLLDELSRPRLLYLWRGQ
jgi:protease-4